MAKRIKLYPSRRARKKAELGVGANSWMRSGDPHNKLKHEKRPTHDPMKELNKTIKRGSGGGGVGIGRWHKDPKTGRRTWKIF